MHVMHYVCVYTESSMDLSHVFVQSYSEYSSKPKRDANPGFNLDLPGFSPHHLRHPP